MNLKNKLTKNIILLLITSIIILNLTGCSFIGNILGGSDNLDDLSEQDFREGEEGVVFEIVELENNDNYVLYDGTNDVQLTLNVRNQGAYDIEEGYALLLPDNRFMRVKDNGQPEDLPANKRTFQLAGRSIVNPRGSFDLLNYKIDVNSGLVEEEADVKGKVCYEYETILVTDVCIDPQAFSSSTNIINKPCEIEDQSFSSQGAPVAITKVETLMLQDGQSVLPEFTIHVENKGHGTVLKEENIRQECSGMTEDNSLNYLKLTTVELMNGEMYYDIKDPEGSTMECFPGPFKLEDNKKDEITCRAKQQFSIPPGTAPFVTPIQIRIDYGYTDTYTKQITVKPRIYN